jgi:hypothetical protein
MSKKKMNKCSGCTGKANMKTIKIPDSITASRG